MEYDHSIDQANEYASEALDTLHEAELPPTPHHYELWYVYYANLNAEVKKALQSLQKENKKITAEECRALHHKYLSDDAKQEAFSEAGSQISELIEDLQRMIRDAKDHTGEYSENLNETSAKLNNADNKDDLKAVLQQLIEDTGKVLEENKKLEAELESTSEAMESLQDNISNIRKEAFTDGLTLLANRRAFDAEIERVIREAEEHQQVFTLLICDIDHFKSFNDNYGHQIGDQVLKLVGKTLVDGIKGKDIAARYGGEEFAIILPDTPISAGLAVGNFLRESLASKDVVNRQNKENLGQITMSVGAAEYYFGETVESLIERADAALYTAKNNGRNQVAKAETPSAKKQVKA